MHEGQLLLFTGLLLAAGLAASLAAGRLRLPGLVLVLGLGMLIGSDGLGWIDFDDFELAGLIDPPVTVVHQDPAAMGQKAAQQLFARLLGDESPAQTVVMPTRLIVRASGVRRATSQR